MQQPNIEIHIAAISTIRNLLNAVGELREHGERIIEYHKKEIERLMPDNPERAARLAEFTQLAKMLGK